MSRPEDIPQDVWEAAGAVEIMGSVNERRALIARAIMAAKAEEREEIAALCAAQAPIVVGELFASIIRQRGEV